MATKIDRSAPPPPQRSVPVRYAHLHYALGRGGQNKTPTTNRKRKVPNLFQDLTNAGIWFLARPLILGAARAKENCFSLSFIAAPFSLPWRRASTGEVCRVSRGVRPLQGRVGGRCGWKLRSREAGSASTQAREACREAKPSMKGSYNVMFLRDVIRSRKRPVAGQGEAQPVQETRAGRRGRLGIAQPDCRKSSASSRCLR